MFPELSERVKLLGDRLGNTLAGMPSEPLNQNAPSENSRTPPTTSPSQVAYPGLYTPAGAMLQQVGLVDGIEVVPAAASACAIYADVLAELPKFVVSATNTSRRVEGNFLTELLNDPCDELNPIQFWMWAGRQRAAYEECFIAIERDYSTGMPIRLIPAYTFGARSLHGGPIDRPGSRVALNIPNNFSTGYNTSTTMMDFAIEDVLHVTGPTYNPFTGSVVRPLDGFAKDAVGLHKLIVNRYMMRLMQGGHDNIIAEMPEREADQKAFMARYREEIAGIWNSGKPYPVAHGVKMYSLSATDVERETVPMLNWMTLEIARGFRIPPHLLYVRMTEGVSARARSDLAEMFLNWIRLGLEGFVMSFTQEINNKIVKPLARIGFAPAMNIKVEFDMDHLTQGTPAQRADIAVKQRQAGVSTVDELRRTLNLPPLGSPEGDELVHSIGAAPTETGGENKNDNSLDNDDEDGVE